MKKTTMKILGIICTGLGFIGIFVPVLPTTPFLLLASFLFSKSSDKFHNWLLSNKYFGHHIKRYEQTGTIPTKVKIKAISTLWVSIGVSSYFVLHRPVLVVLLVLIASSVSVYIIRKPSNVKNLNPL